MKFARMLCVLVSVVAFAGLVNAQHTRLIYGNEVGIWRAAERGPWTLISTSAGAKPVVLAGKTIRLRIATANNRGQMIVGVDNATVRSGAPNGRLYLATDVGVYQVPCDGTARTIGVDSGSQLTITGSISDPVLNWKTEKEWSGTCRMMTVKLRDGREASATVRFE